MIAKHQLVITYNIKIVCVIAYMTYAGMLCRSFKKLLITFVLFSFIPFKEVFFEEVAKVTA